MKRVCIDTHAVVWHLSKPKQLGKAAKRWLRDADRGAVQVLVPAIVAIELSLLRQAGRDTVGIAQLEALTATQPAFTILPLDFAQAKEFAFLETLKDPFDRMIVAAARATGTPLITGDGTIHDSSLTEVIWE